MLLADQQNLQNSFYLAGNLPITSSNALGELVTNASNLTQVAQVKSSVRTQLGKSKEYLRANLDLYDEPKMFSSGTFSNMRRSSKSWAFARVL